MLSRKPLKGQVMKDSLRCMENRGYDSLGFMAYSAGQVHSQKSTFLQDCLGRIPDEATVFMGHTRWATHGAAKACNAHPHQNIRGNVYAVHNGIIQNYKDLRRSDIKYSSSTDSEVLVKCLEQGTAHELKDILAVCQGSWALVLVNLDRPNQIVLARHQSPLVLGYTDDAVYVCSEISACPEDVKHFTAVPEGAILEIELHSHGKFMVKDDEAIMPLAQYHVDGQFTATLSSPDTLRVPYLHWTEQEICAQTYYPRESGLVRLCANSFILGQLRQASHIYLVGCGSSLFACKFAAQRWRQQAQGRMTIQTWDASEFHVSTDFVGAHKVLILVSQSGETHDCVQILNHLPAETLTIAVVNVEHSMLAREATLCVGLEAGKEHGVAATKSFTSQVYTLVSMGDLIYLEQYINHPFPTNDTILDLRRQVKSRILELCLGQNDIYILGSNFNCSIVGEGALKIQELAYIHAHAFHGGALKHGPFALLRPGTPVFVHAWERDVRALSTIQELQAREAQVIVITNDPNTDFGVVRVYVPSESPWLSSLWSVIVYQWLAYLLAVHYGHNPDRPRHLAKTVTVE